MNYTDQISRIQPSTITPTAPAQKPAAAHADAKAESRQHAAAVSADRADLSTTSQVVAAALKISDVRLDKVAHLQQAIASGTYNVSSSDVAGKLLDTLVAG